MTARAAPERAGLWNRDFALFFVARAAARLGDMMLPVGLAVGLIQHGYGAGAVGGAMASFSGCFAGLVIVGGVVADQVNTRTLMVAADLVRLVSQSLMAVMFLADHVVVWQICVIGAINGTCAALFQPGVASTLTRVTSDVQGANGVIRTAESVMTIAGPSFAGVLVGLGSAGGVFACDAATYLVSALCLLALRSAPRDARHDAGDPATLLGLGSRRRVFVASLAEGWRCFWARRWLWNVIVVWMVLMLMAFGPNTPLSATQVITTHGDGAYGVVSAIGGLGMVTGGLLAIRIRPRYPLRAGATALLAYFAQPVAVGLDLPLVAIAGAFAVTGGVMAFWGVMWATTVQTQLPIGVLNRVHAYEVAGSLAMMPVGQALCGPAADLLGATTVLLINGAAAAIGCAVLVSTPEIRNLRGTTAAPERGVVPVAAGPSS